MEIITAAAALGVMGLLFGVVLAAAGKVFAVPVDEKAVALREVLPGANCGACGYPGCDGYAAAVSSGEAPIGKCTVGGSSCSDQMAQIMGVTTPSADARLVATLACQGTSENCRVTGEYEGIQDCLAASIVGGGNKACAYACLGLGTCERACPFDAIHVDSQTRLPVVDEEKCVACEKCVVACPKQVLSLKPAKRVVEVKCNNPLSGKPVMANCKVGCITCGKCARVCEANAITMVGGLPVIDYDKCVGCMMCAQACPTHALIAVGEVQAPQADA